MCVEKETEFSKAKEKLTRAEDSLHKEESKNGDVAGAKARLTAAETQLKTAQEEVCKRWGMGEIVRGGVRISSSVMPSYLCILFYSYILKSLVA